jgi:hypothetical protein
MTVCACASAGTASASDTAAPNTIASLFMTFHSQFNTVALSLAQYLSLHIGLQLSIEALARGEMTLIKRALKEFRDHS